MSPSATTDDTVIVRVPGRVNLIGGHTDYNDGFVLPIATNQSTYIAARPRADGQFRVWSGAYDELHQFSIDACYASDSEFSWSDYVRGMIGILSTEGLEVGGMDLAITGDLPIGAGVSSSASLEVAVGQSVVTLAQKQVSRRELAFLAQRAETEYVGVQCGILDQFSVIYGREAGALLIDCRSHEITEIAFGPTDAAIMVCDTGKQRELVESEYNLRREQCEQAAEALGVESLRDATVAEVNDARDMLGELPFRRARHVVSENRRVLKAAKALQTGDAQVVGELMTQAHLSLRDDYEVSCEELDTMVQLACEIEGCFGARLVGAGFGGSAVALVDGQKTEEFCDTLQARYSQQTGHEGQTFVTCPADGMEVLHNGSKAGGDSTGRSQ